MLDTLAEQDSRMHLEVTEAMGPVRSRRLGLLRRERRSVGPKSVLDHMTERGPEIMDSRGISGVRNLLLICCLHMSEL